MTDTNDARDKAKAKADKEYREAFIKMNEAHMRGVGVYAAIEAWAQAREEWRKFW